MSKRIMSRVLAKLKEIESDDLFVADAITECIQLIERGMKSNPLPYQSHSLTSMDAAISVAPTLGMRQKAVLAAFAEHPRGLTDEEGQDYLGYSGNAYRPRRVELMSKGLICDTGLTKKTKTNRHAAVWGLTEKGLYFVVLEA
jgi:hypothetical protein